MYTGRNWGIRGYAIAALIASFADYIEQPHRQHPGRRGIRLHTSDVLQRADSSA
jgi:hypothetical protein